MEPAPDPESFEEVSAWRDQVRLGLLQMRAGLSSEEHAARSAAVCARVQRFLDRSSPGPAATCIGAYWPFRGEPDVTPLLASLLRRGVRIALPAVAGRLQPLVFRTWTQGKELRPSRIGVLEPVDGVPVQPDVLLIPLVGYDRAGYRLGYGGGFYDRTLAAIAPRPLTLGVGFALGALATIYPQTWDVPLDAILTEDVD